MNLATSVLTAVSTDVAKELVREEGLVARGALGRDLFPPGGMGREFSGSRHSSSGTRTIRSSETHELKKSRAPNYLAVRARIG